MKTTTKTITMYEIRDLLNECWGDIKQMEICYRALAGSKRSFAICARIIRANWAEFAASKD